MRTEPDPAPDPGKLIRRLRDMTAAGRVHAARPLLGALRRMDGAVPPAELAEMESRLLLREGKLPEALAALDAALAAAPDDVTLLLTRADARMQSGDPTGAAADAADAVIAAPEDGPAKAVLGAVLLELGQPADALPCLRAALAADPRNLACLRALATALERTGAAEDAAALLAEAIARHPADVALRTAAIMLAMRGRDFAAAADLAEAARQVGIADAQVFGLRGHALSSLGQHEAAAESYAEALKLAPEDPYVRHLVVAAGLLPQATRAPAPYLETVFDGYASRFEAHLIGLHYRVPGLLRAALLAHCPALAAGEAVGPVLDLGCGTGLAAVAISDLPAGPITGVDISDGMLAEARAKNLYARLEHAELEAFLAADTTAWRIVLAADVFCYFGELASVLTQVHARMAPGGILAFTVEEMDGEDIRGWRLGRQGRFVHAAAHIAQAAEAAGFAPRAMTRETLRRDGGADVPGLLFVLERVRHDG